MKLFNRKGQSTAEYAILIGLVIGVLVVMQTYVKRGLQGRVKDASDIQVDKISTDTNWATLLDAQPAAIATNADAHYEFDKYSAQRTSQTTANTKTTEAMAKGGAVSRDIVQETAQAKGDYQEQGY